jgi:hypothetical protein
MSVIDNWLDVILCVAVMCVFIYAWLSEAKTGAKTANSTSINDSRDQMGIAVRE